MLAARRRSWSIGLWMAEIAVVLAMAWLVGQVIVVGLLPAPAHLSSSIQGGCAAYTLGADLAGGLATPAVRASVCPDTDIAVLGGSPECSIGGLLGGSEVRSCFWEWRSDGSLLVTGDFSVTPPSTPWIHRRLMLHLLLKPDGTAAQL